MSCKGLSFASNSLDKASKLPVSGEKVKSEAGILGTGVPVNLSSSVSILAVKISDPVVHSNILVIL